MFKATKPAFVFFLLIFQSFGVHATFAFEPTNREAETLVRAAIEKMGGEAKLRSLNSILLEGVGHTYLIEQSERPEGPWVIDYSQISEFRDYRQNRLRRATKSMSIQSPQWSPELVLIVSDGAAAMQASNRVFPGSATQFAEAQEAFALSPERVLLTALDAKDLRSERDASLQGSAQHVVAFGWRDAGVRLFLSAATEMPTAIEFVRSYPESLFWGVWGDVKTVVYLSLWMLEPGGLRYPRQWNIERNGVPYQEFTVTTLSLNPATGPDSLAIADEVKKAYDTGSRRTIEQLPLGLPNRPASELAEGIVHIPGRWNVTLIRQPDGLVILEAPISSGYSGKVMAEAKRRFPGLQIKAVISTSDSWPHIGGIREYVARGIPVYALDLNKPILERLIVAPHKLNPDALERARGKKARFQIVSGKTLLGAGPNRLELYPIRTESGERMMMVYFPEHKLFYGSDLAQPLPDGSFFMPEYLSELMDAVRREKLEVTRIFAMHMSVKPWSEIEAAVAKAKSAGQQ